MTIQPRLIPDLDQELTTALAHVDEMLLAVAAWEHDEPEIIWPEPLAQRRALAAARRLWDVIAPTQGHRAAASQSALIFAPDGRYEHIPLRLAAISPGDPAILADAVAVFAGPDASDHVLQALEHSAEVAYGNDSDQACARLLAATGRLAGLLGLPADQDSEQLAALITTDPGRDIVLPVGAEAAYRRYAIRVNHIWRAGDPLHLWQY
jgi:hypothetical protein